MLSHTSDLVPIQISLISDRATSPAALLLVCHLNWLWMLWTVCVLLLPSSCVAFTPSDDREKFSFVLNPFFPPLDFIFLFILFIWISGHHHHFLVPTLHFQLLVLMCFFFLIKSLIFWLKMFFNRKGTNIYKQFECMNP